MTEPAPIYLLRDDSPDGPHHVLDVEEMLDGGVIEESTLSCIEGMKAWRSVAETIYWSYSKLLNLFPDRAKQMVERFSIHRVDIRDARPDITNLLNKAGLFKFPEAPEVLAQVLYLNGCLLMNHRRYISREQEWDLDVLESYPAMKISPFGKQRFERNWDVDWQSAGGSIHRSKKAARKDDPAWIAISDFGFPFPPFSMDVSVGIEELSIDEAERLWGVDRRPLNLPEIQPFSIVGL